MTLRFLFICYSHNCTMCQLCNYNLTDDMFQQDKYERFLNFDS